MAHSYKFKFSHTHVRHTQASIEIRSKKDLDARIKSQMRNKRVFVNIREGQSGTIYHNQRAHLTL